MSKELLSLKVLLLLFQSCCFTTIHSTGMILKNLTLIGTRSISLSDIIFTISFICYFCRFTPEERAKRPQLAHMPFGFGPRSCIGMRFALLEAKMALIELLKKYTFVRAPDTEVKKVVMLNSMDYAPDCYFISYLVFLFRFHCRQLLVLPWHQRMAFISKWSIEVNIL